MNLLSELIDKYLEHDESEKAKDFKFDRNNYLRCLELYDHSRLNGILWQVKKNESDLDDRIDQLAIEDLEQLLKKKLITSIEYELQKGIILKKEYRD